MKKSLKLTPSVIRRIARFVKSSGAISIIKLSDLYQSRSTSYHSIYDSDLFVIKRSREDIVAAGYSKACKAVITLNLDNPMVVTAINQIIHQREEEVRIGNSFALRWSAKKGDLEKVRKLLAAGADPKAYDSVALRWSAKNGHAEIVRLLIAAGADVTADNSEALRLAAKNGHAEVVKLLIEAGADPNAHDSEALRDAADRGNVEVVKLLIEAGADPTVFWDQWAYNNFFFRRFF